jgi:NAD(P)-dependent dehydrogenase (short-subunit alcohol dehydrogenase family)
LDDSQTRGAFEQLPAGVGSLDILVNSAWVHLAASVLGAAAMWGGPPGC